MTKWDIFHILSAMQKGKWDFDYLGDLLNKSSAENLQPCSSIVPGVFIRSN